MRKIMLRKMGIGILSAAMVLSGVGGLTPWSAMAEEEETESLFEIDEDGVLTAYYGEEERVVIPDGVTAIDGYVFYGGGIKEVVIPDSVTCIGDWAFSENRLESITIPNSVKTIGDNAFAWNDELKTVILPEEMESLGNGAFSCCEMLEEITIPKGLTSIGEGTFGYCTALQNIVIPEGVESMGNRAFANCYRLRSVTLPQSLISIGASAFEADYLLQSIEIPESVEQISERCFEGCMGLCEVKLPERLKELSYRAFGYCIGLVNVYIPASLETVDQESFSQCFMLQNVYYGGSEEGWAALAAHMEMDTEPTVFFDCDASILEENRTDYLVNAEGVLVRYMGDGTDITIPEGVTAIGQGAFRARVITDFVIPDSVTEIGAAAFNLCDGLKTLTFPAGLERIEDSVCDEVASLVQVNIPDSVTTIGAYAFSGCVNLKKIQFPDNLCEIEERAFERCGLESIEFPKGDILLREYCFKSCDDLKEVYIPMNVRMETGVFASSGLTKVIMEDGTTELPVYLFEVCQQLKTFDFPDSVTAIPERFFMYCVGLESVYIPATVTFIGDTAFRYAGAVSIDYGGTQEAWDSMDVKLPEGSTVRYNAARFLFTDVTMGDWQETAVRYMLDHKLMSGTSTTTFAPRATMTRGQMVAVLWNMAGKPSVTGKMPFKDVSKTNTFYKAILWASQNKIVNGYANGTFGPKDPLTRQQIATILMNYAKYCGIAIENKADISSYKDVDNVSKSLSSAMQWAVGNKIISGKSSGTMLDPKGNATRVEVAAMVMNYCKKILAM